MVSIRPPRPVRSVFARVNSSLSLASSATLPPAAQIRRASTKPRPRDPPVMSTTLLRREKRSVRITRRASHAAKTRATASRKKRLSMFEIIIQSGTLRGKVAVLQLAVFAIEARDFAGRLAINRPLFQVSAFVARHFTVRGPELGFEFSVLPIELQDHESASRNPRLAVKLVDLLSMQQQFADPFRGWNFVARFFVRLDVGVVQEGFAIFDSGKSIANIGLTCADRFNFAAFQLDAGFIALENVKITQCLAVDDRLSRHVKHRQNACATD